MREEIMKVLNLVAGGAASVPQAMELFEAIGVFDERTERGVEAAPPSGAKFVRVEIESRHGDEVNLTLPIGMIRSSENVARLIGKYVSPSDGMFADAEQAFRTAKELLDAGATGELINIESRMGDELRISID